MQDPTASRCDSACWPSQQTGQTLSAITWLRAHLSASSTVKGLPPPLARPCLEDGEFCSSPRVGRVCTNYLEFFCISDLSFVLYSCFYVIIIFLSVSYLHFQRISLLCFQGLCLHTEIIGSNC